jgi:hypothetical protein
MPCPSRSPRLCHCNYTWRRAQVMKLLVMQFCQSPLQPKYSPRGPVLKQPQSMFLPSCKKPSFTPIQNHRQNHSPVSCHTDRLCGVVVRVPGYRSRDLGSIPGATRFYEK